MAGKPVVTVDREIVLLMQASSQSSGWPPLPGILLEPKAHVQCGDFDRMVLLQVQTYSNLFHTAC